MTKNNENDDFNEKKTSQKKNLSSMQVLKTLQVMLQGDYTMKELLEILNENEGRPVFNNSVVSKYINTCRYCGIEIPKIHNKYIITNLPFGLDLSYEDSDTLEKFQEIVKSKMTKKTYEEFEEILAKINKYANKKISRVEKSNFQIILEQFERAVNEKRRIKLLYKNKKELVCIPIQIVENKDKTFFNVAIKNREKMIDVDRVSGLEVTNEKFVYHYQGKQSVVFELKGGLAKRYQPRENETVDISDTEDYIVVTNRGENKEVLLSRLLRYDDKCEIKNPKSYREELYNMVNQALANYGE